MKKFLAFLLTILMIGGMLPTVFAAEGDATEGETTTLVYDFSATALEGYTGTTTIRDSTINNWKLDRTKSTGYWKYEAQIGTDYIGFQFNGLLFRTARMEEPSNNNAMVFTIEVPYSGMYSPSIVSIGDSREEKTDIYFVSKDVAAEKGWNVKTIEGVRAAIAKASMTNPAAEVKHVVSCDGNPNATVDDEIAENMYLFAGDYYMLVIANEGSIQYTAKEQTYGSLKTLTLVSENAVASEPVTYSFLSTAGKSATTIDMNAIRSDANLDRTISTGAWCFSGINGMSLNKMYPEVNGGGTFRVDGYQANTGNHAIILKANLENSGLYKPSMIYRKNTTYGKLDIYFVPVTYANSKWTSTTTSWNLADVYEDSETKLVASQNGYGSALVVDVQGEYENVYLNSGDYYVLINLGWEAEAAVPEKTLFVTKGLTLTRQPEFILTASKDIVKVGETSTVSAVIKDESGNIVPTNSVTYKSLNPSVAAVNENGVVTGIEDGVAKIQVNASSCGIKFTKTIDITVSRDVKYVFTSKATGGVKLGLVTYNDIDNTISAPWRYTCETNIDTGNVNENGLNFRVDGANIGNGGYVLKIAVETPGIYTPAVSWTAMALNSIVDTYIVPVAYANTKWTMTKGMNLAEVVDDSGVKLIASADMSTGEKKTGSPFKFSEDEYYVIIIISDKETDSNGDGKAFGYIKSFDLDWISPLSDDVGNQYVSLAIANNVNDNIEIKGNEYTRGDEVEIEAPEIEGYTFRHWVRGTEENGELVSTEAKFTYKLITNAYLTAVYTRNTTANTVEFFGGNGEYITSVEVVDGTVAVPSEPKLTGFKFLNWYTAKDKLLSETILDAAVTRAVAVFGDTDDTYTVAGEENLKYDTKITRTRPAGAVVWYRDGIRVGYGTTYEYYVWDNVGKITYVEGTAHPLVVLDKTVKDGNARMIEYDAGGKTIVEVGILFGDHDGGTVDSCEYKATSKIKANHGQFTAKPHGDESYARGYLVYEDNGEYKVVYSD